MRIFVTGATGLIGSAVVVELLNAGHSVLGLARSDSSEAKLIEMGAEVLRGAITDLDVLRKGASDTDGVINLAFSNDFANFQAAAAEELQAIETIGAVLKNTNRPFVIASGGPTNDESNPFATNPNAPANPRKASSDAILQLAQEGVRTSIVRMSICTHDDSTCGFVRMLINAARKTGTAGYIGDGSNRWPAVHSKDVAQLFRLAIEKAPAGTVWQAVGEDGVSLKDITERIAQHLNIETASISQEEAQQQYGFIAGFVGADLTASSKLTREQSGWQSTHAGLLDDIEHGHYFDAAL